MSQGKRNPVVKNTGQYKSCIQLHNSLRQGKSAETKKINNKKNKKIIKNKTKKKGGPEAREKNKTEMVYPKAALYAAF